MLKLNASFIANAGAITTPAARSRRWCGNNSLVRFQVLIRSVPVCIGSLFRPHWPGFHIIILRISRFGSFKEDTKFWSAELVGYPSDVSEEEWAFCAPYLTLMKEDAAELRIALWLECPAAVNAISSR
jgi:hypothetical protein